ncbi:uncharacterized protein ACNLHF_023768 isoform 2-T2 [Anomaloglossus baeobatrachus]|uniref:uncharacterized protein LOC142243659 isoform X2 n=1 Tax=Anomaloglossus baeobatrachus TaxID=238106 RepID=UPI003F4FB638
MMSHCAVRGCSNGSGRTDSSVTFYPFPAEREAAERWARLCGVSGQECSQLLKDLEHGGHGSLQLCSLHFEQEAFETNPDDKTCNVNLRRGAEPTLLLSPAQTTQNHDQVNSSEPAARSPHREASPTASTCPSCARPSARTCHTVQATDCGEAANVRSSAPLPGTTVISPQPGPQVSHCSAGTTVISPQPGPQVSHCSAGTTVVSPQPGPHVSHCSAGTTVVSPQPGVSQIVLNFREDAKSLTLDNVSTESAPQCRGGCPCQQRVVKQVVLIFLDRSHESVTCSSSSQESPLTMSSSTQTEGRDGKSQPSSPDQPEMPVHISTQTSTGTERSPEPIESTPKTGDVSDSPKEQIDPSSDSSTSEPKTQTPPPCLKQSTQDDASGGQSDMDDLHQATPESLNQEDGFTATSQAQIADDQAPKPLRKCEPRPETPAQLPGVADVLETCIVPPPPCVSSSRCSCISAQHRIKQIVVNIVEPGSAAVNEDVPAPCTSRDISPPVVTSQQHQETQTCDWFLLPQRAQENPKSPSPRPPKSHSCPPVLHTRATPVCQEGASGPVYPQDIGVHLEDKVTFEDVAIYFSKEEWELLGEEDKALYREVMSDNYQSLISLGLLQEKPDLVLRMEKEENLWVTLGSPRRIRPHEEDPPCLLELDMDGVSTVDEVTDTSPCTGRESVESSSHLGALMRLVNEIPGFLLGSSVTDGSSSPARSTEDPGNSRPLLEVKTEDRSPACSPASSHALVSETSELAASLGVHRSMEQSKCKIVAKAEKKVAVSQFSRYSAPVSHLPVSPSCIKKDPGASTEGRLRIKQEVFPASCSPGHHLSGPPRESFPVKQNVSHFPKIPLYSPGPRDCVMPEHVRRPGSGGGTSLSCSSAASPRIPSVSPNHGANCTGPGDLKIKIKQEDSGSDRDLSESPVYGRKVHHPPRSSSTEREHWHLAASPLRSPADVPLGSSPLHRLVNCLKEISAVRPRLYNSTWSNSRWGAEASASSPREPPIPVPPPNPFTVAVTNGAAQLRGPEPRTSGSQNTRAGRDESHMGPVPLSALGKCLEKIHSRISSSEEPRRTGLGVKRTHSDDPSCRSAALGGVKRPTLDVSGSSRVVSSCSPSHRDLWRPPEELPRAPSEDHGVGNSHLMSVMNCVRKIPGRRLSPSVHVASPADIGRSSAQGLVTEVKVKQEKEDNHPRETSRQWIQPPQSPDTPKQSGSSATNVHLTGLMRLMEEIPCAESSNPSRAMYSIAVGHSLIRRMDRSNHLSCNDDCSLQEELNDGTIASVDSVYSDDTSWSSENVDPSYSAIGGLQRVVSEFAELGSVSPLVAVAAPPVSSVQEAIALKKPKDASIASTSRLNESIRRAPREAAGIAASACSTENGEAATAAIRGLQKVVHGFVEQECVSPITAVRIATPSSGPRDYTGKKTAPDEEVPSPHLQGSSPAPISHYLCDSGKWLSEPDSSYSALSGLQKVVNGFSEMSCVSPFSAVSTPVSEGTVEVSSQRKSDAPALDLVSSPLIGQKNVINGAPDSSYLSPLRVASVSSESDASLSMKSRDETSQKCFNERQRPTAMTAPSHNESEHSQSSSSTPAASNQCIDLTQEEETVCNRSRTAAPERKPKIREGRHTELPGKRPENPLGNRTKPPASSRQHCNQLIDLTLEDETLTKPKISGSETARKPSHAGMRLNPAPAEKPRHSSVKLPKAPIGKLDKPLDPGASGSTRGAVPAVNEHLSGLEKLLNGVPTFPPVSRPSGQALGGGWWFKSTSSPET